MKALDGIDRQALDPAVVLEQGGGVRELDPVHAVHRVHRGHVDQPPDIVHLHRARSPTESCGHGATGLDVHAG